MGDFLAAVARSFRAHLAAAVVLAACLPALRTQAAELPTRSVLLLQSYDRGSALVQHLTDGVVSVLAKSRDFTFDYRFEYMGIFDADPSGWAEAYRQRLGALRFDIVICADPESLEFLVGIAPPCSPPCRSSSATSTTFRSPC